MDTLHLKIAHEDITVYNAVQKLLYIIVILAGISQVVTGLAIWKPVQFSGSVACSAASRRRGSSTSPAWRSSSGSCVVHVLLALLVPQTLWAMLTGGPRVARARREATR